MIDSSAENASAEDLIEGPRPVLVVDFGAQYAQLIARRVREARVYSEVIAHDAATAEFRDKNPVAIILSGGPASVYADDAPGLDPEIHPSGEESCCRWMPGSSPGMTGGASRPDRALAASRQAAFGASAGSKRA